MAGVKASRPLQYGESEFMIMAAKVLLDHGLEENQLVLVFSPHCHQPDVNRVCALFHSSQHWSLENVQNLPP